jgi:hypothetical protein
MSDTLLQQVHGFIRKVPGAHESLGEIHQPRERIIGNLNPARGGKLVA